jgi:hypothetical protein
MLSAADRVAGEQSGEIGFFLDALAEAHQLSGETEAQIMAIALAHMAVSTPIALRCFAGLE